jgi:hypothetical protein
MRLLKIVVNLITIPLLIPVLIMFASFAVFEIIYDFYRDYGLNGNKWFWE